MTKTPEVGDTVVWTTSEGALHGTVSKVDQFGINIWDEDKKVHRLSAHKHYIIAVVDPENRLKFAYALSSALKQHLDRLDASHAQLKYDRDVAIAKWRL